MLFAADRMTGKPVAGCDTRILHNQKAIASGTTGSDGVFDARFTETASDDVISVAQCGSQVTAVDPEAVPARVPARAGRLRLHRQADLPARARRPSEGRASLAVARRAPAVRAADVEVRVSDVTDKVIYSANAGRSIGSAASRPTSRCRQAPRSAATPSRSSTATTAPRAASRSRSIASPSSRFESHRPPLHRAGRRGARDHQRALLLWPAGGRRPHRLGRASSAVRSAVPLDGRGRRGRRRRRRVLVWRRGPPRGHARLDANGTAEITVPVALDEKGTTTACASRRASPTPAAAR